MESEGESHSSNNSTSSISSDLIPPSLRYSLHISQISFSSKKLQQSSSVLNKRLSHFDAPTHMLFILYFNYFLLINIQTPKIRARYFLPPANVIMPESPYFRLVYLPHLIEHLARGRGDWPLTQ